MEDNLEVIDFLQLNVKKVNKLLEYHYKFKSEFIKKLDNIDNSIDRDSIRTELNEVEKLTAFSGSSPNQSTGRFTYQGDQLIKYNIIVGEISLFYEIGISDYKLHSYYWFADAKHQPHEIQLTEKGIDYSTYDYKETSEKIAERITQQLREIIYVLANLT